MHLVSHQPLDYLLEIRCRHLQVPAFLLTWDRRKMMRALSNLGDKTVVELALSYNHPMYQIFQHVSKINGLAKKCTQFALLV